MRTMGLMLMSAGVVLAVIGAILYFGQHVNFLGLGRLSGDIRIERENVQVYIPVTTSILISVVLTLLFLLLSRLR